MDARFVHSRVRSSNLSQAATLDPVDGSSDKARRALATPVGLPTNLAVALLALFTLWVDSMPPGGGGYLMLLATWAAIGVFWFVRIVGAVVAGGGPALLARWGRSVAAPLIVLVTAGLIFTSAPLHARVAASLGAMNDLARTAMDDPTARFPDRVGLFPVTRVDTFDGGMRFLVTGEGMNDSAIPPLVSYALDEYGFAYSPDGRPPRIGEDTYWHLRDGWYLWEESW